MSEDDLATAALQQFLNAAETSWNRSSQASHTRSQTNCRRTIMVVESYKNKTGTGGTHRKTVYVKADKLEKRNVGGGPPTVSLSLHVPT